jgi:hypothetical protein
MKSDMDLIREIPLAIETKPAGEMIDDNNVLDDSRERRSSRTASNGSFLQRNRPKLAASTV